MRKSEKQEAEKALIIMTLLMKVLILTGIVGVFWLVRIVLSQTGQLNDWIRGFNVV
jgi:hypothetical protein